MCLKEFDSSVLVEKEKPILEYQIADIRDDEKRSFVTHKGYQKTPKFDNSDKRYF